MDELQRQYREILTAKIEVLEAAQQYLATNGPQVIESIKRVAHTLKGSGGTYGFPEFTIAAEAVNIAEPDAILASVGNLIAVLGEVASGGSPAPD